MTTRMWAVGLEDFDGESVDLSAVEKPEEAVETHLVEVDGLDNQLESLASDGEQLADDTEVVEQIHDEVEQDQADGGMDESDARKVDIAVESIAKRWGIRRQKVGTENFSGSMRAQSTRVALESIKETLKAMWDKLVEWIMVVVNKVREIWVKYINAGKAMRKRADKLSERLDKGLGEKTKDTVGGSFVQQLTIAAKPDFEKTIALAEEADRRGKDLAVNGKRNMENAVHAVGNAYNSNTDQNKIAAKFDANADFNFGTKTDKALKSLFPEGASNAQAYCVPGNGYLATYTKVAKEAVTGTNAVAAVEVACMRFKTISENSGDKKLDTLAEAAMRKAIKAIYKYGSALETVIKDFEKYASIASSLKDAAKTASEKVENAKDDAGKETGRVARVIATEAMANFNASRSVFAHTCRNGGFGLIGYVQASLGAYKAA